MLAPTGEKTVLAVLRHGRERHTSGPQTVSGDSCKDEFLFSSAGASLLGYREYLEPARRGRYMVYGKRCTESQERQIDYSRGVGLRTFSLRSNSAA